MIEHYDPHEIFNETVLFYKALPESTHQLKGSKSDDITVCKILFCSKVQKKLKPIVIGQPLNPRYFKNINKGI